MYNPYFPSVPFCLGLYPIVDNILWIKRLLSTNVRTLQLRIKDKSNDVIEASIITAIALSNYYHARLFINDYWQLAVKYNAYGVHLGQEDLQTADLQHIRAANLRLGISTYDDKDINIALAYRPSYISLAHIFTTQTKFISSAPQGLEKLANNVALLADYPTVAIGGINIERAPEVLATGVGSIAVISAITHAHNWKKSTMRLLEIVNSKR